MASTSLRRRIVGAYVLVALALGLCFSAIAYYMVRSIEDQLVNHRLEIAADTLIRDHIAGVEHRLPGFPVVLHDSEIDRPLGSLLPGIHEMDLGERAVHVLVRDHGGRRYVVVDDESQFERIEDYVLGALVGAVVLCIAVAAGLGLSTASRVIAPVTELAQAVHRENLGAQSPLLQAQDELGLLARAFAAHSERLRAFLEREQLFTGDVSHELRTPLTIMMGAAELLHARLEDRPDLQEVADRIRRTSADSAERVAALLLLSRAPDAVDAPLTDLVPLIRNEVERCRPLVRSKPVALHVETSVPHAFVAARPELAAIAFGNLIRNACQFTDSGEVRIEISEDHVVVQDTGSGVPPALGERIFERYVRGDVLGVEGSGLGLAIVRRVAEHLGWEVRLHCPAAGGSRFEVCLNARKDPA